MTNFSSIDCCRLELEDGFVQEMSWPRIVRSWWCQASYRILHSKQKVKQKDRIMTPEITGLASPLILMILKCVPFQENVEKSNTTVTIQSDFLWSILIHNTVVRLSLKYLNLMACQLRYTMKMPQQLPCVYSAVREHLGESVSLQCVN